VSPSHSERYKCVKACIFDTTEPSFLFTSLSCAMIPLLFFTPEMAWQVRSGPCTCIFPEQCDSQQPHLSTLCPSNDDNVQEPCTTTSANAYNEISYCAALSCNSETENPSESSSKTVPSLVKPFNSVTPEIEKMYVHKVYDAIAPHFSATRFAKWPKVALFLNSLEPPTGGNLYSAGT
jgi:hypothetical protein